jgi:hypothetical protein
MQSPGQSDIVAFVQSIHKIRKANQSPSRDLCDDLLMRTILASRVVDTAAAPTSRIAHAGKWQVSRHLSVTIAGH